jgi:phage gpG-like protein
MAKDAAHGLYVAAIFLQTLAKTMQEEWMEELLHNLSRDAEERARNKLGMYQPPENILGYTFPGWPQLSEKYKTWKMAKVGMDSPGVLRGRLQDSIRSYVITQVDEAVIGTDEESGYWFELGTRIGKDRWGNTYPGRPPRPFLAPAVLEATRDWIVAASKLGLGSETSDVGALERSVIEHPTGFYNGAMAEAISKLRQAMTDSKVEVGVGPLKAFIPAVVERVFPGVKDTHIPTGMEPPYTGYLVGTIPRRIGWRDYFSYMQRVRDVAHVGGEALGETSEEIENYPAPDEEDIDF